MCTKSMLSEKKTKSTEGYISDLIDKYGVEQGKRELVMVGMLFKRELGKPSLYSDSYRRSCKELSQEEMEKENERDAVYKELYKRLRGRK